MRTGKDLKDREEHKSCSINTRETSETRKAKETKETNVTGVRTSHTSGIIIVSRFWKDVSVAL